MPRGAVRRAVPQTGPALQERALGQPHLKGHVMERSRILQDIIKLYDEYTHAPLDRRIFLERLSKLAGGTAAVTALRPD